jgi:hypothetical protein
MSSTCRYRSDGLPDKRTSVKKLLLYGVHDIKVVEDLVDVFFPQSTDISVPARPSLNTGKFNELQLFHGEVSSERISVG